MELINSFIKAIWEFICKLFNTFCNNLNDYLTQVIKEMYKIITKFPELKSVTELQEIYNYTMIVAIFCITILIVYIGARMFITSNNTMRKIELKSIFGRIIYCTSFFVSVRVIIDLIIKLNNTLVEIFTIRFDVISSLSAITQINNAILLISAVLTIYQIYLALKIIVGYWLRVAEVFLMYIVSPIMAVIWINPNWGGYLNQWCSRLVNLIFTQFIQVLIMVLYSKLIVRFFSTGDISGLCLGIAFFILMNNAPNWLSTFMSADNSAMIMAKTFKSVKSKVGKLNILKPKKIIEENK